MKVKKLISFILVIVFMMVFGCSNLLAVEAKPPLSEIRITGEILAGGVGGILIGVGGCLIGAEYEKYKYGEGEYRGLWSALFVAPIGYTLGNAIGVYLVGNIGDETGSFLATLGGSILGLGVGVVLALSADSFNERAAFPTFVASSSICATIGFNLTRRYNSPPATRTAPIRLDLVKVRF